MELFTSLTWWHWYLIAILLLGMELLAPGAFFLWVGVGAGLTGVLVQVMGIASWQVQCLIFVVLSFISLFVGRRVIRRARPEVHSTLNRRLAQYVGRSAVLEHPIENGVGKARFGDTLWRVRGTDCPAGTRITVVAVDGSDLLVRPETDHGAG